MATVVTPQEIIYGLTDPTTGDLRYVGQTSLGLKKRLSAHLSDARCGKGATHLFQLLLFHVTFGEIA